MTETIEFEYETPGGLILIVEASVTPGTPARILGRPPEDAEPAVDAEVEIVSCSTAITNGLITLDTSEWTPDSLKILEAAAWSRYEETR